MAEQPPALPLAACHLRAAQHQLSAGALGCHVGILSLPGSGPQHSWFPCNEDVKTNRTGGRWWLRRTSNSESPEQLKAWTHTLPERGQGKRQHRMVWAASLQCGRKRNLLLSAEQGMLVKGQEGKLNALWLVPLLFLSLQSHFTSSHQVTPAQGGQSKLREH